MTLEVAGSTNQLTACEHVAAKLVGPAPTLNPPLTLLHRAESLEELRRRLTNLVLSPVLSYSQLPLEGGHMLAVGWLIG
jgi:hypothetical protein